MKEKMKINYKIFSIFVIICLTVSFPFKKLKCLENKSPDDSVEYQQDDLLSYVEDFINLPKGGTPWKVFGKTEMKEYKVIDKGGNEWTGVRPIFNKEIIKLDSKEILVQGYMFPLDQDDEQNLFLLLPFPLSCPYHPHVSSNLLIEVHVKESVIFSYEAVNIKGKLELVPKDDEYNIFFRLKNAELVKN